MIKLLAIDMDGTCLDQRSRMTDRTLDVLRKAAKAGITVVPCTGRNLGCIPHRLAAGVLRESKTEDDEKKQRSVSLCDHFKRSYGDRCKRKEDIVQGSDKKRRCAFDPFRLPKR